jgi:uncharacterized membrane protein YgdD (TMEM256/DUF423 family)
MLAAVAIVLGAFGAHAWKDVLGERISTFELANDYHIRHALAILVIALIFDYLNITKVWPLVLLLAGVLCFSGSLYLLSFPGTFGGGLRSIMGPITPIGGLLMIAGWFGTALMIMRHKNRN